jgi:transposase InsO family protein
MIDKWLTLNEIAQLLSRTKGPIIRRAKLEYWPYRTCTVRGGQERRYPLAKLPEDVQTAYAASLQITFEDLQNRLKPPEKPALKGNLAGYSCRSPDRPPVKIWDKCTEDERNTALLRRDILRAYENSGLNMKEFIGAYETGLVVPELKAKLGRWGHIHTPSVFYRLWLRRYTLFGLEGLVPRYAGRGGPGASLPETTKEYIRYFYCNPNKRSGADIQKLLEANYGIRLSEAVIYRYLKTLPKALVSCWRDGKKNFEAKAMPYIRRDYTKLKAMETICGDYMTQDLLCRINDKVFRAKVAAFMDMRSRAVLGWSLQTSANTVGVIRSVKMMVEKYGPAETVYIDNGKEFKNYWFAGDEWKLRRTKIDREQLERDAGICRELGMSIIFTEAYHGQSKPIERFWRTLHEWFDKAFATYFGSNTADRKDDIDLYYHNVQGMKKHDITKIPAFEFIERKLGDFFEYYNHRHHHTGQGMEGRTPMEVFEESRIPRRDIPAELQKYIFTTRYQKTVTNNGVRVDNIDYYNPALARYIGEQVEVRRGLDDAGTVHIFSLPEGKYLMDAEDLAWSGNVEEDIRKRNSLKKQVRAAAKKLNEKKEELDATEPKQPFEAYAEEQRKVSGGDPVAPASGFGEKPELKLVKPGRKLKGLFD